jgi:hypothetical protein
VAAYTPSYPLSPSFDWSGGCSPNRSNRFSQSNTSHATQVASIHRRIGPLPVLDRWRVPCSRAHLPFSADLFHLVNDPASYVTSVRFDH